MAQSTPSEDVILVSDILCDVILSINKSIGKEAVGLKDNLTHGHVTLGRDIVLTIDYNTFHKVDIQDCRNDLVHQVHQAILNYTKSKCLEFREVIQSISFEKSLNWNKANKQTKLKQRVREVACDVLHELRSCQSITIMRDGCPGHTGLLEFAYTENESGQSITFNGNPIWLCSNPKAYDNSEHEEIFADIYNQCILFIAGHVVGIDAWMNTNDMMDEGAPDESIAQSPYVPFIIANQNQAYPGEEVIGQILENTSGQGKIH